MRTVTIYLDKNEKQTTKEKAWTVVTKVYNDAGNLQRTGYTLGEDNASGGAWFSAEYILFSLRKVYLIAGGKPMRRAGGDTLAVDPDAGL